ncbi:CU044_2847 family protein [Actinoplanes sp. NPDC024001]|uniref:CU044_2847 family protein n=1 Tax=Actinoplanes sp. NPDC024001 TaxID=3154598 RepID=UPI0033FAF10D
MPALLAMSDVAAHVVPVEFAGVEILVQATPVNVVGSEPTSAASQVKDAYERAEAAVLGVAESVAGTIDRLIKSGRQPREVQVEFGLNVSLEGNVLMAKGKAGAALAVTLTYDVAR